MSVVTLLMNQAEYISREQSDYDDTEFDLMPYVRIVWREKVGIVGLVCVVALATMVVVSKMTPIYGATASLLIESEQANVVSIEEVYGIDSGKREYLATQFEILNSRELAETSIRNLNLMKHAELGSTSAPSGETFNLRRWIPFLPEPQAPNEEQLWYAAVGKEL